jgi:hypothetical protein
MEWKRWEMLRVRRRFESNGMTDLRGLVSQMGEADRE